METTLNATRIALTPEEVAARIGYRTVRPVLEAIHAGELAAKRIGRRFFVPLDAFERWWEERTYTPATPSVARHRVGGVPAAGGFRSRPGATMHRL